MDQVDFRYPLLGGVEPVMITSLRFILIYMLHRGSLMTAPESAV